MWLNPPPFWWEFEKKTTGDTPLTLTFCHIPAAQVFRSYQDRLLFTVNTANNLFCLDVNCLQGCTEQWWSVCSHGEINSRRKLSSDGTQFTFDPDEERQEEGKQLGNERACASLSLHSNSVMAHTL